MSYSPWHPSDRRDGFAFHIDYDISWDTFDLRIIERRGDIVSVAQPVIMQVHDPSVRIEPCMRFDVRSHGKPLQHLFEALWAAGYRPPKEELNLDAVVQAKDENLCDLRTIINKLMET